MCFNRKLSLPKLRLKCLNSYIQFERLETLPILCAINVPINSCSKVYIKTNDIFKIGNRHCFKDIICF